MNIEAINYATLIPYKISDVASLALENNKQDFLETLKYLYESKLYNYLSDETTKLWHLSAEKLFDMLEHEKKNNELQFPDFV